MMEMDELIVWFVKMCCGLWEEEVWRGGKDGGEEEGWGGEKSVEGQQGGEEGQMGQRQRGKVG